MIGSTEEMRPTIVEETARMRTTGGFGSYRPDDRSARD
jgi:hypothetical protein